MATILCIDDTPDIGCALADTLRGAGHEPLSVATAAEALAALSHGRIELIIANDRVPGVTGRELLAALAVQRCATPVVIVTDDAHIPQAGASLEAAARFAVKPLRAAQVELVVEHALEAARLRRENAELRHQAMQASTAREIVGESPAIRRALQAASAAASGRGTVLLLGESGTGKAFLARVIHDRSGRRDGPFIAFHCAALANGPVERALFGREAGALPEALHRRGSGGIERASGGTLLLDEISELPMDLQTRLLRLLTDGVLERAGGSSPIRVDVRVIATSTRDLTAAVDSGRLLRDLLLRLSDTSIRVPALRDRKEDIPRLAHHFAQYAARESGKDITAIAPEAIALLQRREWPGNVRELRHVIERAVILSDEPVLGARAFAGDHLDPSTAPRAGVPARGNGNAPYDNGEGLVLHTLRIDEAESALIARALEVTGQNRTRAAALLGISVRTLRYKLNGPSPTPRPPAARARGKPLEAD